MTTVAHTLRKGYRTLRLPLAESEYDRFLTDRSSAKDRLEDLYGEFAELLPEAFPWGYAFFGFTKPSIKQQLLCRRIRLNQGHTVFTIVPAFVRPSMTGRTQDVDQALFLMRFHVPCWAIAHVFGRDAMYWYRLEQGLGRFSLVGTTVKTPEHLPKNLVADEKHSWLKGERVYIATTAAQDCILGASVALSASQRALEKAMAFLPVKRRPWRPIIPTTRFNKISRVDAFSYGRDTPGDGAVASLPLAVRRHPPGRP